MSMSAPPRRPKARESLLGFDYGTLPVTVAPPLCGAALRSAAEQGRQLAWQAVFARRSMPVLFLATFPFFSLNTKLLDIPVP